MLNTNSSRRDASDRESEPASPVDGYAASPVPGVAIAVVTTVYTATQSLGATIVAAVLSLVLDCRFRKTRR
jgi:hypothetical protein